MRAHCGALAVAYALTRLSDFNGNAAACRLAGNGVWGVAGQCHVAQTIMKNGTHLVRHCARDAVNCEAPCCSTNLLS